MFNPHARVSTLALTPGACCVVIDDVLQDPHAMVSLAQRHRDAFTPAQTNGFPGIELPLPESLTRRFVDAFLLWGRPAVGIRRVRSAFGRLSMVTHSPSQLTPLQRLCHRDRLGQGPDERAAAGVLYLFADEALGGTNFFVPRGEPEAIDKRMREWAQLTPAEFDAQWGGAAGYMVDSNAWFERVQVVEPRFNRLIWYDGSFFHGSHITQPGLLRPQPESGRLTVNLFLLGRAALAPG